MFKAILLISFLFLLTILFSSCGSSRDISREELPPACTDKLFLELQKRDSSTYSEFEKNFFLRKQNECREGLIKAADKKEHDEKQEAGEKVALGMVVTAGVVLLGLLVFGLAGKSD